MNEYGENESLENDPRLASEIEALKAHEIVVVAVVHYKQAQISINKHK